MRSGDTFTDGQGRTWSVGEMLGRGAWGMSFAVRDGTGRELVAKVALTAVDFPQDTSLPKGLVDACREQLDEQLAWYRSAAAWLPRVESVVKLPTGGAAILTPRYAGTLKRRLSSGITIRDTVNLLLRTCKVLEDSGGRVHGNLRPSNILVNERGEPVLTDWATPAGHAHLRRLSELAPDRDDWRPPEAQDGEPRPTWDTWSMCLVLWRACMATPPKGDTRREERVAPPRDGLDKVEIAALRDRVVSRLKEEGGNPRFAPRVAERLGTLLNRGLSREHEPSPPYRFDGPAALRARLEEIAELLDPHVESVGRVLLSNAAKNDTFQGGEPVQFSVTVAASAGVQGHEDIATGVQIRDLDADGDGRVPATDTRYTVKAHPSGRLRFDFTLPDLAPGRYRANIAFTIKDGGHEPLVASGDFEVRPPPGYVPPAEEPPSGPVPIPLPARRVAEPPAEERVAAPVADADVFPLPIAPSAPGERGSSPDGRFEPSAPGVRPAARADGPGAVAILPPSVEVEVEVEPTMLQPPDAPSDPALSVPRAPPPPIALPRPMGTQPTGVPAPDAGLDEGPTRPSGGEPAWPEAGDRRSGGGEARSSYRPEVDWDDTRGPADAEPYVPGPAGGEDLPSWGDRPTSGNDRVPSLAQLLERGIEIVRRDTYTAFVVFIAGALVLMLALVALARSC